jgi:uncharacterized short protein YbdD (DUF466 family)
LLCIPIVIILIGLSLYNNYINKNKKNKANK